MYSESFMSKTKTADFLCRYLKCVLLALLLLPMKAGAVEKLDVSNFSHSVVSLTTIRMAWPSDNNYGRVYYVYSTDKNADPDKLSGGGSELASKGYALLSNLEAATTYYVWLHSNNTVWSDPIEVATPDGKVSVSEVTSYPTSVSFSFSYNTALVNSNSRIEYVYSDDANANPDELTGKTIYYYNSGSAINLRVNTKYYVWCRGIYSGYTSAWSDPFEVSTSGGTVSASAGESYPTSVSFNLSYDNPNGTDSNTRIEYVYSDNANADPDELEGTTTSYNTYNYHSVNVSLPDLHVNTTYYVWCRGLYGVNGSLGTSSWSSPLAISTTEGKFSASERDSYTGATKVKLDFSFVNSDDNYNSQIECVEYVYSNNANANLNELEVKSTNKVSSQSFYDDLSNLHLNTTYYIWCRGVYGENGSLGRSDWSSSPLEITTSGGTVTPMNSEIESNLASVQFGGFYYSEGATAIEVVYSTNQDADPDELAQTATVQLPTDGGSIENLQLNTTYYFWFRGVYGEDGSLGRSGWTSSSTEVSTTNIDINLKNKYDRNNQNLTLHIEDIDQNPQSWELAYTTDSELEPDNIETVITFNDGSLRDFTVENLGLSKYYFYLRANYGVSGKAVYTPWESCNYDMGVNLSVYVSANGRRGSIHCSEKNGSIPERWEIVYTTDKNLSPSEIGTVIYKNSDDNNVFDLENLRYADYYFYVRGYYGAAGYSPWSEKFDVAVTPPGFPWMSNFQKSFWKAEFLLSFGSDADMSKYKYAYSLGEPDDLNALEYNDISTYIKLNNLTPRGDYYFYVKYDDKEEIYLKEIVNFKADNKAEIPTVPDASITTTSAQVRYNYIQYPLEEEYRESSWQMVCVCERDPNSGTPVEIDANTREYQLEDLTPGTTYYVYVRANFGGEIGFSEWSDYYSFTTKIHDDEENETYCSCSVYDKKFHSATLSFDAHGNSVLSDYEFAYTTDPNVDKSTLVGQTVISEVKLTDLTPWAKYYVYLRYNTGNWYQTKNFVAEELLDPEVSDVTAFSATINWEPTDLPETAWQVKLNDDDPIDVNTTSYTFTGLSPRRYYNVFVRVKTDERYGTWSQCHISTPENVVDGPVYVNGQQITETYSILGGEHSTEVAYLCSNYTSKGAYRVPATFEVDNVTYKVVSISCISPNATAFDASDNPYLTSLTNYRSTANLTSLNLSGCTALTEIGARAFENSSLKGVLDLSSCTSLSTIGDYTFSDCNSITSINLPGSLTSIGANAFSGSSITYVNFENGTEPLSIGYFGFAHMPNLKRVNLPNNLQNIGGHFLCGCAALKSLVIPASVKNIEGAFLHGCQSLENVYLLGQPGMLKSADVETGLYSFGPVDTCKHVNNCTFWVNDKNTYYEYIAQVTDGEKVWARLDAGNDYNTKGSDNTAWTDKRYYFDHKGDFTEANGGYKNKYAWEIQSSRSVQALKWSTICFPFGGETTYKNYLKEEAFKVTDGDVTTNYVDNVIIAELIDAEPDVTTGSYNLTFKQVSIDNLESNKPYLIYMPRATELDMLRGGTMEAADWTRDVSTTVVADADNNVSVRMRGNYIDNKYLPKDLFYLVSSTDNDGHASMLFKKTATCGGTYVPPYRCYFEILKNGAVMNNARLGGMADYSQTTAIEDVQQTTGNERQAASGIYTISGMRMNVESPKDLPRGIYIVDGQKVVVK